MMPDFAALDVGMRGREWWQRCQPQIGYALASGALVGLLIGGGLAVREIQPDTLMLWSKYKIARAAAAVGLSSVNLKWPGERGEALISVDELLKRPGLDAWAEPVSEKIGSATTPSLIGGILAFLATLLWSVSRAVPDRVVGGAAEPVVAALEPSPVAAPEPVVAALEPSRVAAEMPLPVILPYVPPPPVERPHLSIEGKSPSSDHPPTAVPREAPNPVEQPRVSSASPASRSSIPVSTPPNKSSLSYQTHWGLSELPFENTPDPKFYFAAPMHEEALHRVLYGIQTRKGAVMLTGEIGCGKTLISRELGLHLSGQQYDLALIANPGFGVEDFLTEVLYQLGIEPAQTKVKLLHLLNEHLHDNYKKGKQTVVVVDEAQAIPDNQVFEELRLLLNFQLNDRFLLTLVLMGQPELNERVMGLKQFAQRISIKYHLGAFSQEETAQYVQFRLKTARCQRDVFAQDALVSLHKYTSGIPRNINTICDLCLLIGYMERASAIDHRIMERAAAEQGQLGLF